MPVPMRRVNGEAELAQTTHRLLSRFKNLSPSVVEATARSASDQLSGARIVDYVPVLVERRALQQLRKLAAEIAQAPPPVGDEQ